MPLLRPIQTRFPYGSGCNCLNLATKSNSPAHSPKGTPSHLALPAPPKGADLQASYPLRRAGPGPSVLRDAIVLRPLVGIRFQVLFHSSHRGTFHLSLTVLVHYRSSGVFSLGRWASLLPTGLACPVVLRITAGSLVYFRLRDCHPLWSAFPVRFC